MIINNIDLIPFVFYCLYHNNKLNTIRTLIFHKYILYTYIYIHVYGNIYTYKTDENNIYRLLLVIYYILPSLNLTHSLLSNYPFLLSDIHIHTHIHTQYHKKYTDVLCVKGIMSIVAFSELITGATLYIYLTP